MIRIVSFCFVLIVVMSSCGNNDFFNEDQSIENTEWDVKKPVKFEVNVTDTVSSYAFFIDFRNNDQYPYANIYFLFDINFPDGRISTDTFGYVMQTPDGKWIGKNSGSIVDNHILVKPNVRFPVSGKYQMSIRHNMRDDKLQGVEDVGLSITKKN